MKLKYSTKVRGIRPEILVALMVAERVWESHDAPLVVTSCTDGTHSVGSLHYTGCAVDLRIHQLAAPGRAADELRNSLGEDYDVVQESTHIHVEYQPKAPLNEP